MRNEQDIAQTIQQYADTVRRICFVYTKNKHDSEDIFQDVFVKYATGRKRFADDEHKKAWLIRVTINQCKDFLRRASRNNRPISEIYHFEAPGPDARQAEVLEAVMALSENYRTVIYLHYFEGYTAPEIGKMIRRNKNTIYTWLTRAREELRELLGGEPNA